MINVLIHLQQETPPGEPNLDLGFHEVSRVPIVGEFVMGPDAKPQRVVGVIHILQPMGASKPTVTSTLAYSPKPPNPVATVVVDPAE